MPFEPVSHVSDEKEGECHALFWNGGRAELCRGDTRRVKYRYCRSCFEAALKVLDNATAWPPRKNGRETRVCIDYFGEPFLLSPRQMSAYADAEFDAFDRRQIEADPNSNLECHVYLLRLDDGGLYIGQSYNKESRIGQHLSGAGAKVTRNAKVIAELGSWPVTGRINALRLERQMYQALKAAGNQVSMGAHSPETPRARVLIGPE